MMEKPFGGGWIPPPLPPSLDWTGLKILTDFWSALGNHNKYKPVQKKKKAEAVLFYYYITFWNYV